MKREEATYQYCESTTGEGMFFYTDCCNNRMFSMRNNPMTYHGCLCPKCFWNGKNTILYLRSTPDGIRVFKTKHIVKADSEE